MDSIKSAEEIRERIDELERLFETREPDVQAFLREAGRFDRLRNDAAALLNRFPDPAGRPPLFGVTVGVKDIFHVAGFKTHAGSRLPEELLQGDEAESVRRLKAAGALIVGKTVTTEFAYFSPGPTRNPHNLEHTPGGSSSGSAAAVAAGFCSLALGTQTIGSIIRPAAFCGVVGLKPSYERISRAGAIPFSPSLDHVGFFTPDVAAAEIAARCLYENWDETVRAGRQPVLGIPEGPYLQSASEEGLAHFEIVCQRLTAAGHKIRRVAAMPDFADICARHNLIAAAEVARVHAEWFKKYSDLYAPKTAEVIRQGQQVSDDQLAKILKSRIQLRGELTAAMEAHRIDLWIAPSTPGPAPKGLSSTGDPVMNLPWTHAGLPAINLPAGKNQAGLPLGLQVIGRWQADEALLAWSEGLELDLVGV